jgi:hypothetical protein
MAFGCTSGKAMGFVFEDCYASLRLQCAHGNRIIRDDKSVRMTFHIAQSQAGFSRLSPALQQSCDRSVQTCPLSFLSNCARVIFDHSVLSGVASRRNCVCAL